MDAIRLICWPGAEACTQRLALTLHAACCGLERHRLANGETRLRVLDDVRGRDVAIVAQLRDPDPQLPGLLFLADTVRELGAQSVGLVAPYLPYLRQDDRRDGEAMPACSLVRWIAASFDWLVTVDPHASVPDPLRAITHVAVPSAAAIALWIQGHVDHPHLVAADAANAPWMRRIAEFTGCGCSVLGDGAELRMPPGRTPVLVADIVSGGHTLAAAVQRLRRAGTVAPVCIAVHAVLADGAEALLLQAGAGRIVSCNSLPHPSNAIDLCEALAEGVRILADDRARCKAMAATGPAESSSAGCHPP